MFIIVQMHMKHYHPELLKRKTLLQAPNVADLAYARTVGDHLDMASQSPSSVSLSPIDFMIPDKKIESTKKAKSETKKHEKKASSKRSKESKRDKVASYCL